MTTTQEYKDRIELLERQIEAVNSQRTQLWAKAQEAISEMTDAVGHLQVVVDERNREHSALETKLAMTEEALKRQIDLNEELNAQYAKALARIDELTPDPA